jgi:hypothetical protein
MPDEIVVVNSDGERIPFKEAWLRGTLVTIREAGPPGEVVLRAVHDAIVRSPDLPRDEAGRITRRSR